MNYFYAPQVPDGVAFLDEEESGHCIRVLRHKEGDIIGLLDGNGGNYKAVIEQADPKKLSFRIIEKTFKEKPPYSITLAIAPTKSADRMEWLAEKLTEIGIDRIYLFFSRNSERKKFNVDRLRKKTIGALKQSKNPYLPELYEPEDLKKFLKKNVEGKKFIAVADKTNNLLLHFAIKPQTEVTILVGPEGDFTSDEVANAERAGYDKVDLGDKILRTETAGLIAVHTIHLINNLR